MELTAEELSGVLHVSRRTMSQRKKEGRLKPDESERVLRLIRLYRRAADVLGRPEGATEWLREENFALSDETPLEFADTEPGARRVERLLVQIEHGVPTWDSLPEAPYGTNPYGTKGPRRCKSSPLYPAFSLSSVSLWPASPVEQTPTAT
ncbi:MbcA/ParS/Xre antitoxin family protein [Salinibacter ruber]|uniref:type II RES/Xre toxin-antitoxin system antitoxin n=1 Tax=Salinibacter ruber TaxID=146919 RepID=UPI0015E0FDF2